MHSRRIALSFLALLLFAASWGFASSTATVGGPGGARTVVMDCGASSFIVGATATGGKDLPLAPDLLRKVRFKCRAFSGTTAGSSTSQTPEASADVNVQYSFTTNSQECPSGRTVTNLQLSAGLYIDRFTSFECQDAAANQTQANMNVGGSGGDRKFIECPKGEALYKVTAKVGSAIDSLQGSCRTFGGLSSRPLADQVTQTASPKPSISAPLKILPAKSASISFTVLATGLNQAIDVGITAETDFLGGGNGNPPDFKLELLNPSGQVVKSQSFTKSPPLYVRSIPITFTVEGTWKLRITNLKPTFGALDVKGFEAGTFH